MKYRILVLRTFFLFVFMFSSFPTSVQSRPSSRTSMGPGPPRPGSGPQQGRSGPYSPFSYPSSSSAMSSIPPTASLVMSSSSGVQRPHTISSPPSSSSTSSLSKSPSSLKTCPFLEGMFSPWPDLYRPDITMKVWETTLVLEGTARSRSEVKPDGTFGVTFDLHRIVKGEAPLLRRRKQFRLQFLDNPMPSQPPFGSPSIRNSVMRNVPRSNMSYSLHSKVRNARVLPSHQSFRKFNASSKSMAFHTKSIRPGSSIHAGHVGRCAPPRATVKTGRKYFVFASKWENHFVAVFSPELANKRNTKLVDSVLCPECRQAPSVGATKELELKPKERIRIKCRLRAGNPVPPLTWYKDGRPVNLADGRFRLRAKRRQSILVIRKSKESDVGDYKCEAKNYLGSAQAITRVYIPRKGSSPPSKSGHRYPPSSSSKPIGTTPTTLWPLQSTACPFDTYCLNGGTCSYYSTIGEYVCQCAEGYKGQRCDTKEIPTSGSPTADLESSRMVLLMWS